MRWGSVLARSSMSPVIYEVLDFACGVCDPAGQLIAQTNGITVFTGTFSTQIGAVLRKFKDNIYPGDIFLMNNSYEGGTDSLRCGDHEASVYFGSLCRVRNCIGALE